MQVFKFGGASVKDADSIKNVASILNNFKNEKLVVVVSAMGKTTNNLEKIVNAYYFKNDDAVARLNEVKIFHNQILDQLFSKEDVIYTDVNNFFVEIEWMLDEPNRSYAFAYDQIVSIGELVSTKIISAYLNKVGNLNFWLDVRSCVQTDNNYRSAKVNWELTEKLINLTIPPKINSSIKIVVVQGFIGSTSENYTTTLGREGSDYTASIFAYCLNATSVTIWKDVPGVLNADPKFFDEAQRLDQISYLDAIELAYYGATVIHPKTIKPLENKGISLYVKSFLKPDSSGTVIGKDFTTKPFIPTFIFKSKQELISISAKDFSFIAEESLHHIFGIFIKTGVKINLMQNSAISFSVCVDNDEFAVPQLLAELKKDYKVLYNDNLLLYTIRHYNQSTIEKLTKDKEILLEQRSRHTVQFVMRAP